MNKSTLFNSRHDHTVASCPHSAGLRWTQGRVSWLVQVFVNSAARAIGLALNLESVSLVRPDSFPMLWSYTTEFISKKGFSFERGFFVIFDE